jgi:hypothetical protein
VSLGSIYVITILRMFRADYVDDDYIQELIAWRNPNTVPTVPFQFTEAENLAILNLPRKECKFTFHLFGSFDTPSRSRGCTPDKRPVLNSRDHSILLRLRDANDAWRSYPRECLDHLLIDTGILCS